MYVLDTGPLNAEERTRVPAKVPAPLQEHLQDIESRSFGRMRIAAPVTQYSETRAFWERGAEYPGSGDPVWLPR